MLGGQSRLYSSQRNSSVGDSEMWLSEPIANAPPCREPRSAAGKCRRPDSLPSSDTAPITAPVAATAFELRRRRHASHAPGTSVDRRGRARAATRSAGAEMLLRRCDLALLLRDVDVNRLAVTAATSSTVRSASGGTARRLWKAMPISICGDCACATRQLVDEIEISPSRARTAAGAASAGRRRSRSLVQRRQQREPDPCRGRGIDQRLGHRTAVRVGRAVRLVVQIVKLAHGRIAGLEHVRIALRRDRVQALGRHAAGVLVHGFAPGPEAVCVASCGCSASPAIERWNA